MTSISKSTLEPTTSYTAQGIFCPTLTGDYVFKTTSDDASFVVIGGTEIVNNGGDHSVQSVEGTYSSTMQACESIEVMYGNNAGGGSMVLAYKKPGSSSWISDLSEEFYTYGVATTAAEAALAGEVLGVQEIASTAERHELSTLKIGLVFTLAIAVAYAYHRRQTKTNLEVSFLDVEEL